MRNRKISPKITIQKITLYNGFATTGLIIALILLLPGLLLYLYNQQYAGHSASSSSSYHTYSSPCLPSDISLGDKLDPRFGPKGTLASQLESLNAHCGSGGTLITGNGNLISFFQPGSCSGNGNSQPQTNSSPDVEIYLQKFNLPAKLPICS